MTKVLLTTVIRPFGGPGEGDSVSAELFNAQVTRAQGIFSFRQVIRCWAIDYIAANIEPATVALHYPSKRELARELKNGKYDYVGINFVVSTFHKVREMVPLIKKHAPHAKIVLGGYGTVLPDDLLKPYGDYICREEGIGFMRKLLGEDAAKPIHLPYVPIDSPKFYSHQLKTKVAHVTGGLGCPNGCDFCCTSHFFKRKYVPFVNSGKELYETLARMQREADVAGDQLSSFILIDEDFFIHKKRAMEFLECVRAGGKAMSIMGFGSIKGLSQFTPDEIAEMGFDNIWTAFEGVKSGYGKLQGKPIEEVYNGLKSRGITLLSSMIVGFPYQTTDTVWSEFDRLMELNPTYAQFLIYFAFPGTPFHKQVIEENRYLPEYAENPDLRRWDGFSMHFKHDHFGAKQLETLQKNLFRQDFARLGPSIIRAIRVWFEGYKNMKDSQIDLLKQRAVNMKQYVRNALPGIYPAIFFGPNRRVRDEARRLLDEIVAFTGKQTLRDRVEGYGATVLAVWTWIALKLNVFQQPELKRYEHRVPAESYAAQAKSKVMKFVYHGPPTIFARDMIQNVRWRISELSRKLSKKKARIEEIREKVMVEGIDNKSYEI